VHPRPALRSERIDLAGHAEACGIALERGCPFLLPFAQGFIKVEQRDGGGCAWRQRLVLADVSAGLPPPPQACKAASKMTGSVRAHHAQFMVFSRGGTLYVWPSPDGERPQFSPKAKRRSRLEIGVACLAGLQVVSIRQNDVMTFFASGQEVTSIRMYSVMLFQATCIGRNHVIEPFWL
jgi:hypothetical protein